MGYANQRSLIAVGVIFPSLASLAVGSRLYARRLLRVRLTPDDYMIFAAMLLVIGLGIATTTGAANDSLGTSSPPSYTDGTFELTPQIARADQIQWAKGLLEKPALALIKLSILIFYKGIFSGRCFNLTSTVLAGIVVVWGIAFFFTTLFRCRTGFSAIWGTLDEQRANHCFNSTEASAYSIIFALSDFATDVSILCLPIPIIWRLDLSKSRKYALACIFFLGATAIGAGAVRLGLYIYYSHQEVASEKFGEISAIIFWSIFEQSLATMAACIPTFGPLLQRWDKASELFRDIETEITLSTASWPGTLSRGRSRTRYDENSINSDKPIWRNGVWTYFSRRSSSASQHETRHPTPEIMVQRDVSVETYV
ncbi:hypothetical protein MMC25_003051 [Agyrium rufum]|nr:hypothetical protein [Agyrium rufum]